MTCAATLRVLATTDLHMQILPFDYFTGRPDTTRGLVQLADQIMALKSDPEVLTLLFDNGDFLQGNPLADTIAQAGNDDHTHPMIAAFGALRYDAVALGNHEFNYGLPFLRAAVKNAAFPVLCANINWRAEIACAQPYTLLNREVRCTDGHLRPISIGVLGLVPPQITDWDRAALQGTIGTSDMVATARRLVPKIKAAGADVIIALCHTGIGAAEYVPGMDNAAVPLAAVPGIDVILTGHKHEIFPDPGRKPTPHIDPVAGQLHGKPAVSAGFCGNMLGVITLDLEYDDPSGWRISRHESKMIPASTAPAQSKVSHQIVDAIQPHHTATLARMSQPVAHTTGRIHNFFATVAADLPRQILAEALVADAASCLPGLKLPLIAAVSPFHVGGRAGAGHYIDVPPGPINQREICAVYPYADTPVVVRQTGQALRDWLERAVSGYCRITPGSAGQPLLNPLFPAYTFDALYGLTYTVDLSRPARHDAAGSVIVPQTNRIVDLRYLGRQVQPDDLFAVTVNSYRVFGGGGYVPIPENDILHRCRQPTQDTLADHLRLQARIDVVPRTVWRFAPVAEAGAVFSSAPEGRHHARHPIRHLGPGEAGFHTYELIL